MNNVEARPDGAQDDERDKGNTTTAEVVENAPDAQQDANTDKSKDVTGYEGDDFGQADTFPRPYVEKLRTESAGYRERAKTAEERADTLAHRLHAALVTATGKLVDPDALPFDAEHLDDDEKLSAAIEQLTTAKPYLKARKATGDAGQGPRGSGTPALSWADLFTNGA